jgi:hypothetical protein
VGNNFEISFTRSEIIVKDTSWKMKNFLQLFVNSRSKIEFMELFKRKMIKKTISSEKSSKVRF